MATCQRLSIPSLTALLPFYRAATICAPPAGPRLPLHLFAHANFGGGPLTVAYDPLLEQVAARGFVVAAFLSCGIDAECVNGEGDFIDLLKTIEHLQQDAAWAPRIDFNSSFSISGHSTGARAVLMLAALRDDPAYLQNTSLAARITPTMRQNTAKIGAVVANHPDMMYDSYYNPDMVNYRINRTPVLILTGSNDTSIEKPGSAWRDFRMMSTPDKVFVNVAGAVHSEPVLGHRAGPFTARRWRATSRCTTPRAARCPATPTTAGPTRATRSACRAP